MKPSKLGAKQAFEGVTVTTYVDEDGDIRSFKVEGHAGFAPAGQDIVCAAVSVLAISAANGLEHYLSQKPVSKETEGYLECALPPLTSEGDQKTARVILGTMMLGLKDIRRCYGAQYIRFEQRRWTPC